MNTQDLFTLFKKIHTIAIIGLSPDTSRPSYAVGSYLQSHGYRIIPVNPACDTILGESCYKSVSLIPKDIHVDVVDVFRKPEAVQEVIDDVEKSGRHPVIWLQEGVGSIDTVSYAQSNGFVVVADMCMKKVHMQMCELTIM